MKQIIWYKSVRYRLYFSYHSDSPNVMSSGRRTCFKKCFRRRIDIERKGIKKETVSVDKQPLKNVYGILLAGLLFVSRGREKIFILESYFKKNIHEFRREKNRKKEYKREMWKNQRKWRNLKSRLLLPCAPHFCLPVKSKENLNLRPCIVFPSTNHILLEAGLNFALFTMLCILEVLGLWREKIERKKVFSVNVCWLSLSLSVFNHLPFYSIWNI